MGSGEGFETPWAGGGSGVLALDFVDTVDWRLRESPVELLQSPADLLRWARSAGVLDAAEARALWPDSFLWLHPSLTWFRLPLQEVRSRFRRMAREAGPRRYCFEISEEVPQNWRETIPSILSELASWDGTRAGQPPGLPGHGRQS